MTPFTPSATPALLSAEASIRDKARFKIDATGSEWNHERFAVYERFSVLGFRWWGRVFTSSSPGPCRVYIEEATKLPEYHA